MWVLFVGWGFLYLSVVCSLVLFGVCVSVFCGVWFFLYFYFFRLVSKHILEKCLEIVPTFSLFHVCTGIWTVSIAGVI